MRVLMMLRKRCIQEMFSKEIDMKKMYLIIIMALMSVLASDPCYAQFKQISIDDYSIESIVPESFSSVRGSVMLEVDNAGEGFAVSDIVGVVYKEDKPLVTGRADAFYVAKGEQKEVISGRASLCSGASLWSVLGLLFFDPEDYKVDISVKITTDSGVVRVLSKKGMPVTELLKIK